MPDGVVEWLQGFLLQVEISAIVAHEADEPNPLADFPADFPDAELLAGQDGGDMDSLAVQAEAARGGDDERAVKRMYCKQDQKSPLSGGY